MTISPKIKKVWNIITTVIVILVVVFAAALMGARLIGLQVYNVISGSMSPTYNVGDLIYVKKVDPATVKSGDVITFILNEQLQIATHRVVSVDEANSHIYTKGDANEFADAAPVHYKNVIGTPVFKLPLLGFVSDWVQNPPGTYITIAGGAVLIILVFLPDMLVKKPEEEKKEEKEE